MLRRVALIPAARQGEARARPGASSGAPNLELADGGTLFLDEVGEIPLEHQTKLLRVLQEGTCERIGDAKSRHTDVRVIAATNRDLAKEVERGHFRADLYYRLGVFPIEVPPLRERREDLPALAQHFITRSARRLNLRARRLTSAARASSGSCRASSMSFSRERSMLRRVGLIPAEAVMVE